MRRLVGAALAALVALSLAPGVAHAGKHRVPARVLEARSVALGYVERTPAPAGKGETKPPQ